MHKIPEIEVDCPACDGEGLDFDEHPHCGKRDYSGEKCHSCKGTGKLPRLMNEYERLERLEKLMEKLSAKIDLS